MTIPPRMRITTWGTRTLGISAEITGASAATATTTLSSKSSSRMSIRDYGEPRLGTRPAFGRGSRRA